MFHGIVVVIEQLSYLESQPASSLCPEEAQDRLLWRDKTWATHTYLIRKA